MTILSVTLNDGSSLPSWMSVVNTELLKIPTDLSHVGVHNIVATWSYVDSVSGATQIVQAFRTEQIVCDVTSFDFLVTTYVFL